MKRILSIILMIIVCLTIIGCDNKKSSNEFADESFINDLQKGLEKRWDLNNSKDSSKMSDKEYKDLLTTLIQTELDEIEKYKSENFNDTKLQEHVISYINILHDQLDSLDYYTADYTKFNAEWSKLYDKRTQLINIFYNDFGLQISEKHQDIIDELIANSKVVTEKENIEETVDAWIQSITFEKVESDSHWNKYQAIVENTTGYDFERISLSINLIDSDDIVIDTAYSSFNNISSGAKVKFEFSTMSEFESTDITGSYTIKE